MTAFNYAVSKKKKDAALFLIEKGIDVNARERDGRTALMWASYMGGDPGVVRGPGPQRIAPCGAGPRAGPAETGIGVILRRVGGRDSRIRRPEKR